MEMAAARAPLPVAPRPSLDRAADPPGSLRPGLAAERPMAAPPGRPCGRSQPGRARRQAPEPTRDARSQRRAAPPSSPPMPPASAEWADPHGPGIRRKGQTSAHPSRPKAASVRSGARCGQTTSHRSKAATRHSYRRTLPSRCSHFLASRATFAGAVPP